MSEFGETRRGPVVRRRALLGLLLVAPLLAGCGKKGPLSPPGEAGDAAEEERRARERFEG